MDDDDDLATDAQLRAPLPGSVHMKSRARITLMAREVRRHESEVPASRGQCRRMLFSSGAPEADPDDDLIIQRSRPRFRRTNTLDIV